MRNLCNLFTNVRDKLLKSLIDDVAGFIHLCVLFFWLNKPQKNDQTHYFFCVYFLDFNENMEYFWMNNEGSTWLGFLYNNVLCTVIAYSLARPLHQIENTARL